jgi:hypothetical protein
MRGTAVSRGTQVWGVAIACATLASAGGCGARTGLVDLGPVDVGAADVDADAGDACAGLCAQVAQCTGGVTTTLSGTAFVPNGVDPLYNAVVYIPNGRVEPFTSGLACNFCGVPITGDPIASTRTGVDGRFVLSNVPAGTNIPLVIQAGKWRRQITIDSVVPCAANQVDPSLSRLPRDHTEGDIPFMAVVTGEAEALECALLDYGVSPDEFTGPAYSGRVQVYVGNGATIYSPGDPDNLADLLPTYDAVFYDCDGMTPDGPSDADQPIIAYANAGGRVFTSHFGYGLLENAPFSNTMMLAMPTNDGNFGDAQGVVAQTKGQGQALASWLSKVGALSADGTVDIQLPKQDLLMTVPPANTFLTTSASSPVGATTQLYTFTTPVGTPPADSCGVVVYASYHVDGPSYGAFPPAFPASCMGLPRTPQEKAYEFFVFDWPTCAP